MVETQLTPELVREGAALVKKLDESDAAPDAAFWFYFPDTQTWKLFVVETRVAQEGPREVYRSVQKALQSLRNEVVCLSLEDVAVAKPDMPLVALLSRAISTGPGIGGIRFSRNVINGQLIEDAYIYRMKRSAAERGVEAAGGPKLLCSVHHSAPRLKYGALDGKHQECLVQRHTLFAMQSIVVLGLWACSRPPDKPTPDTVGTSTHSAFDSSVAADESSAIAVDAGVIAAIVSALDSCTSIASHGADSVPQPSGSVGNRRWAGSVRSFGHFRLFLPDSARILQLDRPAGALRVDWPMCSDYCRFGVSVYADSGVDLSARVARLVAEQRRIDSVNRDPRAEAMEFDEITGPPRPVMTPAGRAYVIDHSCGDCAATTLRFGRSGKIADVSLSADAMPEAGRRMCEMMVVARSFAWEP